MRFQGNKQHLRRRVIREQSATKSQLNFLNCRLYVRRDGSSGKLLYLFNESKKEFSFKNWNLSEDTWLGSALCNVKANNQHSFEWDYLCIGQALRDKIQLMYKYFSCEWKTFLQSWYISSWSREPFFLWGPKPIYSAHDSLPLDPFLGKLNPVYTITS